MKITVDMPSEDVDVFIAAMTLAGLWSKELNALTQARQDQEWLKKYLPDRWTTDLEFGSGRWYAVARLGPYTIFRDDLDKWGCTLTMGNQVYSRHGMLDPLTAYENVKREVRRIVEDGK